MTTLELGLDTFGDVTLGDDGTPLPYDQVIRNVVEQAVLADELGLAFFGVGEHHREDFAVTAPEVVLAAIAAHTTNIHLGTAVTVLSSDDPIRVYERFATLDALSNGRAEVILGRGSFTESFPLFGYDVSQYRSCSAKSSTCSPRCARKARSSGPATSGRRSMARKSFPRPPQAASRRGSASAAARSR